MTAKEKANELIMKYDAILQVEIRSYRRKEAKECALITVDEILNLAKSETPNGRYIPYQLSDYKYWQEVKSEIEKI